MNSCSPSAITQSRAFDRSRRAALTAAIACVAIVGIGLSLTVPLLSLEMERMGVSGWWIGINTALAGVAGICVVPFVPGWAARFGILPLLWAAVAVGAASLLLFKVLFSFAWWFPLRFLFSAALGTLFVLSEYWINAVAPPGRRGLVMGIYATVLALGLAAGPSLLAAVGTAGWPPYWVGALLFGAAALPLAMARGLSPEVEGGTGRTVWSFLRAAPSATAAALVFGAVETGGFALLPVYGLRVGLGPEAAAFLVSMVALGSVAFQIPLGALSDRMDRRVVLVGAALVGLLGAGILPLVAERAIILQVVLFVWGGVTGVLYTVGLAHLGARFAGADLVSANAAFILLYHVGLVLGPPVVGLGMDILPPHGFAFALAAFFALYLVVVVWRMAIVAREP